MKKGNPRGSIHLQCESQLGMHWNGSLLRIKFDSHANLVAYIFARTSPHRRVEIEPPFSAELDERLDESVAIKRSTNWDWSSLPAGCVEEFFQNIWRRNDVRVYANLADRGGETIHGC